MPTCAAQSSSASTSRRPTSRAPRGRLGSDSAAVCQDLCAAEPGCKHWYAEYEMDKYECYLKGAFGDEQCHEYSYKDDRYQYSLAYQHNTPGADPFVVEGYANWGGPNSSDCISPAPYSTVMSTPGVGPGNTGLA